jgi:DNA polymerase-3 subunit epsilon/ribonuclease T
MEQQLVFFDLETGGLDPKRHPIIQLAAVAIDHTGEVLEAFEAKLRFNPKKANAYSLRKNHYHPGVWAKEAGDANETAKNFAAFLRRHATTPMLSSEGRSFHVAQLVAHNAAFDGPFLATWYERLELYLPARRQVLCTLQLALWHFTLSQARPPSNYQLATLCAHFGIRFHAAAAHEALADVTATVQLFRALSRIAHPLLAVAQRNENVTDSSFD